MATGGASAMAVGGLTQRRRGFNGDNNSNGASAPQSPRSDDYEDEYNPSRNALNATKSDYNRNSNSNNNNNSSSINNNSNENIFAEFKSDEEGFTDQDLVGKRVKLTLMEECLLLGIRDEQGWYSWWNENMSYVLRACLIAELAMRGRVAVFKELAGRHHRKPFHERLIDVVDDTPTGEALLDEALKLMKMEQSASVSPTTGKQMPGRRYSVSQWVDLLSGETWNLLKYSYQMKLVRERLSKGMVDKGVLRTEKKNFLVFEMTTHPVVDSQVKAEIIERVVNCLMGVGPRPTRRTILLCCAAYAGNVLENALGAKLLKRTLTYSEKDACFAKCEEMLSMWSGGSRSDSFTSSLDQISPTILTGNNNNNADSNTVHKDQLERGKLGWFDLLFGVVGVLQKMDTML